MRVMNASGATSAEIVPPRSLLLRRPRPAPMTRIAAAAAGSGLKNTVISLIFPSGRSLRWSVKVDGDATKLHGADEHRGVITDQLVAVPEVVQRVEQHVDKRCELITAREDEVGRERRAQHGVFGERVDHGRSIPRLHRGSDRELGRSLLQR